jgi:hypothetical protein
MILFIFLREYLDNIYLNLKTLQEFNKKMIVKLLYNNYY